MLYRQPSSKKQPVEKKLSPEEKAKIINYWLVEITSTDGEILQFYVSGLTQFDASEKAESYSYWLSNEKLKNKLKTFRLMP
jgi:ribosomal protein S11